MAFHNKNKLIIGLLASSLSLPAMAQWSYSKKIDEMSDAFVSSIAASKDELVTVSCTAKNGLRVSVNHIGDNTLEYRVDKQKAKVYSEIKDNVLFGDDKRTFLGELKAGNSLLAGIWGDANSRKIISLTKASVTINSVLKDCANDYTDKAMVKYQESLNIEAYGEIPNGMGRKYIDDDSLYEAIKASYNGEYTSNSVYTILTDSHAGKTDFENVVRRSTTFLEPAYWVMNEKEYIQNGRAPGMRINLMPISQ